MYVLSFERSQFCSQRLLCRTLAGNNVHVLTISSPDCLEEVKGKICIVLSARCEECILLSLKLFSNLPEFIQEKPRAPG